MPYKLQISVRSRGGGKHVSPIKIVPQQRKKFCPGSRDGHDVDL